MHNHEIRRGAPPPFACYFFAALGTRRICPDASRALSTAITSAMGSGVNSPERKSRICSARHAALAQQQAEFRR